MAYVYAALTIYDFVVSGAVGRISIVAALLNFLIFLSVYQKLSEGIAKRSAQKVCI